LQDVCSCWRESKGISQRHGSVRVSSAKGGEFVQIILNLEAKFYRQICIMSKTRKTMKNTFNIRNVFLISQFFTMVVLVLLTKVKRTETPVTPNAVKDSKSVSTGSPLFIIYVKVYDVKST
jgi:hypothetical protein